MANQTFSFLLIMNNVENATINSNAGIYQKLLAGRGLIFKGKKSIRDLTY